MKGLCVVTAFDFSLREFVFFSTVTTRRRAKAKKEMARPKNMAKDEAQKQDFEFDMVAS